MAGTYWLPVETNSLVGTSAGLLDFLLQALVGIDACEPEIALALAMASADGVAADNLLELMPEYVVRHPLMTKNLYWVSSFVAYPDPAPYHLAFSSKNSSRMPVW